MHLLALPSKHVRLVSLASQGVLVQYQQRHVGTAEVANRLLSKMIYFNSSKVGMC